LIKYFVCCTLVVPLHFKLLGVIVRSSIFSENLVLLPIITDFFWSGEGKIPSDFLLFIIIQTRDEALFFFKYCSTVTFPRDAI